MGALQAANLKGAGNWGGYVWIVVDRRRCGNSDLNGGKLRRQCERNQKEVWEKPGGNDIIHCVCNWQAWPSIQSTSMSTHRMPTRAKPYLGDDAPQLRLTVLELGTEGSLSDLQGG